MGVGGKFWELLKPYGRHEGFDYLRDKRVAVDLSFWIVQHETAIKAYCRNPHLRLTFFRTINLFSKVFHLPFLASFIFRNKVELLWLCYWVLVVRRRNTRIYRIDSFN